ncbi:hypothetical protein [Acidianus sp. RZ1]|uniref:hypothetical protein n=1 Tax=Acidianus sp. RZ1 TaxID=1540082 RepID=UPI001490BB0C|nr:hypothetical protein [Acidianus sp. RZ1]NON61758.1 hypothetical protein [Acidianus sp. RZ1]
MVREKEEVEGKKEKSKEEERRKKRAVNSNPNMKKVMVYFRNDEYNKLKEKAGGMPLRSFVYYLLKQFLESGNYTVTPSPGPAKGRGVVLELNTEAYDILKKIAEDNGSSLMALIRAITLGGGS